LSDSWDDIFCYQIIAPILGLMLADGEKLVTIVCPGPLLPQSRAQLRSRFSNVLPKRILTLTFERSSPDSNNLAALQQLHFKLEVAKKFSSIVLTTPQSVKSLFLKYVDLLQQVRNAPDMFKLPPSKLDTVLRKKMKPKSDYFVDALKMADCLRRILGIWSGGVALLDEVDLLLHPLKSELNFPIGLTEALPMLPQRYELPLHLMDPFFSRKSKKISKSDEFVWDSIQTLIEDGKRSFMFQSIPHLVLLNEDYFTRMLRFPVSRWAVRWIVLQKDVYLDISRIVKIPHYTLSHEQVAAYLEQYLYCEAGHSNATIASEFVKYHFATESVRLLNLARQWVWVYLPHVLSKIHRVSFGLIGDDDIQRWKDQEVEAAGGDPSAANNVVISKSRRLLAVPFVGKDVPSRSSEFANPEVQIGLTILAYKLHGLRQKNTKELVTELKRSFLMEPGPFSDRPSRILFEEWKTEAALDTVASIKADRSLSEEEESPKGPLSSDILPLEILQTADDTQMQIVTEVLKLERSVVTYYLTRFVFPNVLKYKATKLQANGIDLGGEMIFGGRFGFSGTPSDLLPLELRPCRYEPGSEAEIIRTLSNTDMLSVPPNLMIGQNWDVDMLLERVAQGNYSALIDCGALITGYTPEQVARKLLEFQHPQKEGKKEVCVFLDERDLKMVVDVSGGPAYELDRCGVVLEKRMVFYDHVHTTGIDIKHSIDAVAVCTLGKDLTLRDYSQGCWRMRGLGIGQRVHVLVIEEINKLIETTQVTPNKLSDILAWLTTNSVTSEKMQFLQLENQIGANADRQAAFLRLKNSVGVPVAANTDMFLPSVFHSPLSDSEAQKIIATSSLTELFSDEKESVKNTHLGIWRSKRVIQTERVWCNVGFLQNSEEQSPGDCVHYCDNYCVITSCHWSCCGDRNPNSTACADFDPNAVLDFNSLHINYEPLVQEFYDTLLKLLPGYNRPGQLDRFTFLEALSKFAALENANPEVWGKINGSLYPPYVSINISTLIAENQMKEYAQSLFYDTALKAIIKLSIQSQSDVDIAANTNGSDNFIDIEGTRAGLRSAVDIFMEPINVNITAEVFSAANKESSEIHASTEDATEEAVVTVHSEGTLSLEADVPAPADTQPGEQAAASNMDIFELRQSDVEAMLAGQHGNDVPIAEIHNNDREIVQEQEKERDEEREMEVFKVVHPEADKDPTVDTRWPVEQLHQGRKLLEREGQLVFYPLREFSLHKNNDGKLPYPPNICVSEGYAPFIHASAGNRRLKNVCVLMQWLPEVAESDEEPVTVIISLAEAETLRYLINRKPLLRSRVALWSTDPQTLGVAITAPLFKQSKQSAIGRRTPALIRCDSVDPSVAGKQKILDIAVQFARYFNGCMYFDDTGLLMLLSELQQIDKASRLKLFNETLNCRLRDQSLTTNTPVDHVFQQDSMLSLERILKTIGEIKKLLCDEFESVEVAFAHFAKDRNLEFSPAELVAGLASLSYTLASDDAVAIAAYVSSGSSMITKSIHTGPTISRANFHKLRPSSKGVDNISLSLLEALEGLNLDTDSAYTNIFQGHSRDGAQGTSDHGGEATLKPVNEFFSHLHTPNIQSIGQIVVISTPASLASGQSSRVNISNDFCISTDSAHMLTVAPRGVKLEQCDGGLWCFELTVISAGKCFVGFTDAKQSQAAQCLPTNVSSRLQSPMVCGVSGAKTLSFEHAAKGDVVRFFVDLNGNQLNISYRHYHCGSASGKDPVAESSEPVQAFCSTDFAPNCALFPFVTFDKSFKFRLNFGGLPFCSQLGNMPPRAHSLSHWIRTQQERQYVRNRFALGGYGNLSNFSGRFHLEIAKLDNLGPYHWEMKMATKENQRGHTQWEAAFPTVFVDGVLLTQGKWYYEVTIRTNNVATQFGWADMEFVASNDNGQGVGDDKHSWAFDGDRKCLWHARSISYGDFWKVGDVLGCACDLDVGRKTISFSLNGHWYTPVAFPGIQYSVGLMPALTTQARLSSISYYVNLSKDWKFKPPGEGYAPICDWIEYGKQYFANPAPSVASNTSAALGGLGSPVDVAEVDVATLPSAPFKMFRQVSAQPKHLSSEDLWYVPIIVKSGHDQVVVTNPASRDQADALTSVCCCSEDDNAYPSVMADRVSLSGGKWFYEISLRAAPAACKCSFGFAEQSWVDGHWSEMSKSRVNDV
jgi:hypothetical protein